MGFFKTFFSSCLGTLVALAIFISGGIFLIGLLAGEKQEIINDNSVLVLKLTVPITELETEDPLAELLPSGQQGIGLIQLKEAIAKAKDDSKIKGIYLNTSALMTGPSSLEEIRQSLLDFRQSGKWIISYADFYTEGAYYLATAADKVYLNAEGQVEFNGLATEVTFFKKLFDKLSIKPEIFRVGDFKSAVEPFFRENLSDENKLQLNSMLQSIYGNMLTNIAEARKIPKDRLKEISDKMLVRNAKQALEYGLIDSLYYDDQVKDEIRARLNLEKDAKISFSKYDEYKKSFDSYSSSSKNEIAVIVADGDILPGEADQGVVGSATIREAIRKARTNDRVKAIVIRVNSPGGAFQAADEMWREVSLASKAKPTIASMGDYAASGGYYLAMACDTIVAQPVTITGSIGVFSVLFDLSQFLGEKIGITSEEVKTGEIGELVTVTRPLTEVEKNIWQTQTNEIYETFTSKAAKGRKMEQSELKKIASGRVWTGEQAKANGLVDVLGGFNDAIKIAASRAGISQDYKLRFYPKQKTTLEKLFGTVEESTQTRILKEQLGEHYPVYLQWQRIKDYQGTQARMPLQFQIQ
jgi:protease-4